MSLPRRVVLVSGPPASGKTTLARPLAERLGFALLSRDDIKESLYTSLDQPPGDLLASRRIGDAAMDLLWALAPHCPSVVLEANFRTRTPRDRARLASLQAALVEVHCRIPLDEASRRFARRALEERHHPAHPLTAMSPERMAEYDTPFALGPVLAIDTTQPVDIDALAARVTAALRLAAPSPPPAI